MTSLMGPFARFEHCWCIFITKEAAHRLGDTVTLSRVLNGRICASVVFDTVALADMPDGVFDCRTPTLSPPVIKLLVWAVEETFPSATTSTLSDLCSGPLLEDLEFDRGSFALFLSSLTSFGGCSDSSAAAGAASLLSVLE